MSDYENVMKELSELKKGKTATWGKINIPQLPELVGTLKQIKWADDIRSSFTSGFLKKSEKIFTTINAQGDYGRVITQKTKDDIMVYLLTDLNDVIQNDSAQYFINKRGEIKDRNNFSSFWTKMRKTLKF